jgi:hypothetical protein
MGYVMNDDAISYIDDIKRVYNSYKSLSDSLVPIKFPLKKFKKEMIIDELPEKYSELTITCEEPRIKGNGNAEILDYDACGYCPACKRQLNTGIYKNFRKEFRKHEIESGMNSLLRYGEPIEEKKENDRYIVTISLPDDSLEKRVEPQQLYIDFNQIEKA